MKHRPKDDSKGLDKLFKLSVLGSVLIVIVYSFYYYSQAYTHTRTNLYRAESEPTIRVVTKRIDTLVAEMNIVQSFNQNVASTQMPTGWQLENSEALEYSSNELTTATLAGLTSDGFAEKMADVLRKKFHNSPPIDYSMAQEGVVIQSVQIEHFSFPYHAMINWKKENSTYKTFTFIPDSLGNNLSSYSNGFEWYSEEMSSIVQFVNISEGATTQGIHQNSIWQDKASFEQIECPIIDFDLLYKNPSHLKFSYAKGTDKQPVIQSNGEIKLLISPSLKQKSAYEISQDCDKKLEIKPPFLVRLRRKEQSTPYFFALIVDEKLLLK